MVGDVGERQYADMQSPERVAACNHPLRIS